MGKHFQYNMFIFYNHIFIGDSFYFYVNFFIWTW